MAQGEARIIGAEVRARPEFGTDTPLEGPAYSLESETDLMRVYRLTLHPDQETGIHRLALEPLSALRLLMMVCKIAWMHNCTCTYRCAPSNTSTHVHV
jgi:hypothetical protein